jgi:hypothetical protein
MKKTFKTKLHSERNVVCAIPVPFDPKEVFGKTRAPVNVTINGFTYKSTISKYGEDHWIPLRKSNREAAGILVEDSKSFSITLELDEEKREVTPPADFVKALKKAKAWDAWSALSFTHQREHVDAFEGAKKPETRARRLQKSIEMILAKAPKKAAAKKKK